MFFDTLQEIFFTLRKNKLRTLLTAFGVFWGIFMLVLLLGAGKGMQNGIEQGFTSDAQNSVWIWARKTSVPYKGLSTGRNINFTEADVIALKKEIPELLHIAAENPLGSANRADIVIKYKNRSESYGVFGVSESYFTIKNGLDQLNGRSLNNFDAIESRKVAMIGSAVANNLFANENPVGESIEINKIIFDVVGTFHDSGQNGRQSERIYIPMSLYQQTFGQGRHHLSTITYQPKADADAYKVEDKVIALLKKRHRVSPDDRSAIRSHNLLKNSEQINSLFVAINSFIWFVGLGTLTAGIVGIGNIMMITVKERTMEIGVRKALGATPTSIVSALLFESVLITATAGYLGLVFGVALLELINYILMSSNMSLDYFKRPEVDFGIAFTSIVILVVVGMLAGFAPAWRAARISPTEAMQN